MLLRLFASVVRVLLKRLAQPRIIWSPVLHGVCSILALIVRLNYDCYNIQHPIIVTFHVSPLFALLSTLLVAARSVLECQASGARCPVSG